jgi:hypothetical protein
MKALVSDSGVLWGGGLPLAGCTKLAFDGDRRAGNKAARQADGRWTERRCVSAASMVACKNLRCAFESF